MGNLKEIVTPFYTRCLTVNGTTEVAKVLGDLLAEGFQSKGSVDVKTKEALIGQIQFFWKLIPDLKWEIQSMVEEGNRVVVRSLASGTPVGSFMGVNADGSKSFRVMTIDVHTIENEKVAEVYHLEDWATAIKQLTSQAN